MSLIRHVMIFFLLLKTTCFGSDTDDHSLIRVGEQNFGVSPMQLISLINDRLRAEIIELEAQLEDKQRNYERCRAALQNYHEQMQRLYRQMLSAQDDVDTVVRENDSLRDEVHRLSLENQRLRLIIDRARRIAFEPLDLLPEAQVNVRFETQSRHRNSRKNRI